jgi:type IV pilus assembly protein PilM
MPALAIDLGTASIKALSAKPGQKLTIQRAVEVANPTGLAIPTDDAQLTALGTLLESMIKDHNLPTNDVRLSLPETVVSSKVIAIPPLSDAELASAITWQAEQHIPIPPEELSLEYQVLFRPPKKQNNTPMRVLLVGARKPVIERYVTLYAALSIEPTVLETQTLSVLRSLQLTPADPATLIVHIGASTMDMALVNQGELEFVVTHLSGGSILSRSLEQTVGLDAKQAEEYKRTYGLDPEQFQGKVRAVLLPAIQVMTTELQKAFRFFMNQHPTLNIQRLVLSGGTAQLPGLVQHLTEVLGVEVLVAEPFATADGSIPATNHPAYSVCVGLLMRQL